MEVALKSFIARPQVFTKRNVKKVPFVELFDGRLQGVVSSGSDSKRVYVSFICAESGNYYCSTNNNRPCGGLRGSPCKHIAELVGQALIQFGVREVSEYMKTGIDAPEDDLRAWDVFQALNGTQVKENASVVFSRFLHYLRYCELNPPPGNLPEMNWFG